MTDPIENNTITMKELSVGRKFLFNWGSYYLLTRLGLSVSDLFDPPKYLRNEWIWYAMTFLFTLIMTLYNNAKRKADRQVSLNNPD